MISVVLATHNEEQNIVACLNSVKDFADEIIIVDGESTDKTVSLAKSLGARVITTTNKPVFHINKQMAMDAARGDLILQLDADEQVDTELKRFIINTATSLTKPTHTLPSAWWIRRKNKFLGRYLKKGGQYPDPVIRLYRQGKAWLPQKDVHEQMEVEGEVGWAEGHLLHNGNPSFEVYLKKWNAYTSLKAAQLQQQGVALTPTNFLWYLLVKPLATFSSLYFRHLGIVDGYPGFVFALFSGLYFSCAYLKLWELENNKK